MSNEKDVYVIDASEALTAISNLKKSHDEAGEATKKHHKEEETFADFIEKDLKKSIASAEAMYDLLKEAVKAVGEAVVEGIKGYLSEESALERLNVALNLAGSTHHALRAELKEQAEQQERTTGKTIESTLQLQGLIIAMGVAPEQVKRFTSASLDLAAAMGTDATSAAKLLSRAHAEGKEELKKYAIKVDDAEFALRGFDATLDAVEARVGGLSQKSIPENTRSINNLKGAWDDYLKTWGEFLLTLVGGTASMDKLAKFIDDRTRDIKYGLTPAIAELGAYLKALTQVDFYMPGLALGIEVVKQQTNEALKKLHDAKTRGEDEAKERGPKQLGELKEINVGSKLANMDAEYEREQKQLEEHEKKKKEIEGRFLLEARAMGKKIRDEDAKEQQREAESESDRQIKEAQDKYYRERESNEKLAALKAKAAAEEKARIQAIHDQMISDMKGDFQSLLSVGIHAIGQLLVADTKYTHIQNVNSFKRRHNINAETLTDKQNAEIQQELAADKAASLEKQLADVLVSIAEQSAIKAILEGAEAIASFASGSYAESGEHLIAAGAYAAVAVAAGGSAAAISSNRGMTADEKSSSQSASAPQSSSTSSTGSASAAAGKTAADQGQVIVYNVGIAGTTEYEQGAELERLKTKYQDTLTGGNK